jgi:hypothetical protein
MVQKDGVVARRLAARTSSFGSTGEEEMILMGHAGQGGRPVVLLRSGQQPCGIVAEVGNARRA